MNKQRIIIETDPGIDDAMAVFFAGLSEKLDLVAMTSVFGNVTLDIATRNAMVLAEILNQTNVYQQNHHMHPAYLLLELQPRSIN